METPSHYTAPLNRVHATKEIILSAGAVGTPIILLLSGIGDHTDLEALSIQSTVHNPSVGRNLTDHVLLSNVYAVNSNQTYDPIFRDSAVRDKLIAQWIATKNGPLAGGVTNHIGWLRLPRNASIFRTVKDPSAGPRSSHWEIIFLVRSSFFLFFIGQVKLTESMRPRTFSSTLVPRRLLLATS
jgi:choline dehydrogenase-like flavoprotein